MRLLPVLAALSGATGVIAGAAGAHAATGDAAAWLRTGAEYQMIHAVAALVVARFDDTRASAWAFVGGGAIFAGTLYAMALGAPRWLGAVTPIGGLCLIIGWLMLAVAVAREKRG